MSHFRAALNIGIYRALEREIVRIGCGLSQLNLLSKFRNESFKKFLDLRL